MLRSRFAVMSLSTDILTSFSDTWKLWIPVPKQAELQEFSTWAVALIIAVAAICLAVFVMSAVLVFVFRKRSIIKYSDPVFIYIMIFGATLATVGVILNVAPNPSEDFSCQIMVWFICCGFTLFFA